MTGSFLAFIWFAVSVARSRVDLHFRPRDPQATYRFAARLSSGFKPILGLQHRIKNHERLTPERPSVFVANHSSNLDVITMCEVFPPRSIIVAKRELGRAPLLGPFLRKSQNILLDRSDTEESQQKMREAERLVVDEGLNVFIFPEGTRNFGELRPFKKGAFHLATNARVPVVPIVCATTPGWIKPKKLWKRKDVAVVVDVLDPLDPGEFPTVEELRDETEKRMRARLSALEEEISKAPAS